MDKFVIKPENHYKSTFDITILLLVFYSCVTSVYSSAFSPLSLTSDAIYIWDLIVEGFFYIDLILNFFHGYHDLETNTNIMDFDSVYKNYLFSWFLPDFVAVFPFQFIFSQGFALKLVRLIRLPRLIKLLEVSRVKKVLVSMGPVKPTLMQLIERIRNLQVYNIIRLILILLMLTFFTGCCFYMTSHWLNPKEIIESGEYFIETN